MKNSLLVLLAVGFLLSGCSVNKYIPEGQSLYVGSKVIAKPDSISRPEISGVASQLEGLVKPPPNKTLLGFPWKVWFYYWIG